MARATKPTRDERDVVRSIRLYRNGGTPGDLRLANGLESALNRIRKAEGRPPVDTKGHAHNG